MYIATSEGRDRKSPQKQRPEEFNYLINSFAIPMRDALQLILFNVRFTEDLHMPIYWVACVYANDC